MRYIETFTMIANACLSFKIVFIAKNGFYLSKICDIFLVIQYDGIAERIISSFSNKLLYNHYNPLVHNCQMAEVSSHNKK